MNVNKEIYYYFLNAVKENVITEYRLNQSLRRIFRIKLKRNLLSLDNIETDPDLVLGHPEHQIIIKNILDKID